MNARLEMHVVAAGRARTYGALSALYLAAPSEDLAEMIRAGGLAAEDSGSPLGAAAGALTASFREAAALHLENELAAEHTRLFVLPSGVLPHESIYLDENKRLGGRVTAGVQRYYENAAAKLTNACLDLPDHIGVELEFMSFLCDLEAQLREQADVAGLQKCLQIQHGFLTQHLLRWHQSFCAKVLASSNSGAYRALANLTIAFLEAERGLVPELIDELDTESRTVCVSES